MPDSDAAALRSAVTGEVLGAWQRLADQQAGIGPELADLYRVGADLLARGKRLRAAFGSAGWRSLGGPALAPAEIRLGAGLELFQMAALAHDDVMDGSLTRRGRPAAHRQFASAHARLGLTGDSSQFGEAGAILLGDLLLVAATAELETAVQLVAPANAAQGRLLIEQMMAEVTGGQFLDIYAQSAPWSQDPAVDLERAWRVIRAKSARYSVEHPLTIGAAMAGATEETLARLRAIGLPIGEAYQLRDDLLGVFGDPTTTGKPAGDDLREGKRTVLLTLAMTLAQDAERDVLRTRIGRPDLDEEDVARIRKILTGSGAVDAVEALIGERYDTAMAALASSGLPQDGQGAIASLTQSAIVRDA